MTLPHNWYVYLCHVSLANSYHESPEGRVCVWIVKYHSPKEAIVRERNTLSSQKDWKLPMQ